MCLVWLMRVERVMERVPHALLHRAPRSVRPLMALTWRKPGSCFPQNCRPSKFQGASFRACECERGASASGPKQVSVCAGDKLFAGLRGMAELLPAGLIQRAGRVLYQSQL